MVKEKSKRQKEIVYPILYECSLLQNDEFWKKLFDDLSRGKCPKGITIFNGIISSTNKRKSFTFNVTNKTDPEETAEELINILKNNAYIYSVKDIENKDNEEESADADNWKKKTKKMKETPIVNYILTLKKKYKLSNRNTRRLYDSIKHAFNYRTHKTNDIEIENGVVVDIADFVYDKKLKMVVNTRLETYDEKMEEASVKDILGNKWEKYVNNVIKSIVKEEI
jgi:hypothetical protein